jgi:hypothetical protein
MMLSVARSSLATEVPASLRPDPGVAPTVTLSWLRAGIASGRIPTPTRPSTPVERRTNELRLSLMELDQSISLPCHALVAPTVRTLAVGDRIGLIGTVLVVLLATDTQPSSVPVSFGDALLNPARVHALVAVAGPLTVRIAPSGRQRAMLCTAAQQ